MKNKRYDKFIKDRNEWIKRHTHGSVLFYRNNGHGQRTAMDIALDKMGISRKKAVRFFKSDKPWIFTTSGSDNGISPK